MQAKSASHVWFGRLGLELAVEHVGGRGAALAAIHWQAATMTQRQHVVPHASRNVCAVAGHEALVHPGPEHVVVRAALTAWPGPPRVEAASRDTVSRVHQVDWPRSSVLRHAAELPIDSLAK